MGTRIRMPAEMAAFANAVAIRCLDGADTYPGGGGHPSDCWSGILAVAEEVNASMADVFTAITVAYEVFHNFFKSGQLREKGIDNVFYATLGTTMGCAKLLGLDCKATARAAALAVTSHISLGVARTGELSMWKSGASGNAARNAVFAALLASEGMGAPEHPFEGVRGLFELTGRFALGAYGNGHDLPFSMGKAHMKSYLCDYHSQTPIMAALALHQRVKLDDIESVTIYTYWFAWNEVGDEPEKWHPRTRETADHSLPWIVAGVLKLGRFTDELFQEEMLRDVQLHFLTDRIRVLEDAELNKMFPAKIPCRMVVVTRDGMNHEERVEMPKGHPANPMTDEDISAKFLHLASPVMSEDLARTFLDDIWGIPVHAPVSRMLERMPVLEA